MPIGDKKVYNDNETIIIRPKADLPQADDSTNPTMKGKWNWMVAVQPVKVFDPPKAGKRKDHPIRGIYYDEDPTAQPILVAGKPYPFLIECTTGAREQEFELIDQLTSDRGNIHKLPTDARLYKYLKHEPDGLYRLVFYKQAMGAQYLGHNVFAFWGWNLISKNQDLILMETRYIQCGTLDKYNLDTRDPREDTRRKHYHEIPSGGIDYVW